MQTVTFFALCECSKIQTYRNPNDLITRRTKIPPARIEIRTQSTIPSKREYEFRVSAFPLGARRAQCSRRNRLIKNTSVLHT